LVGRHTLLTPIDIKGQYAWRFLYVVTTFQCAAVWREVSEKLTILNMCCCSQSTLVPQHTAVIDLPAMARCGLWKVSKEIRMFQILLKTKKLAQGVQAGVGQCCQCGPVPEPGRLLACCSACWQGWLLCHIRLLGKHVPMRHDVVRGATAVLHCGHTRLQVAC
jgi:hypothetical protein